MCTDYCCAYVDVLQHLSFIEEERFRGGPVYGIIALAIFFQEKAADEVFKKIESALDGAKAVRVKFKCEGFGKRGDNETKIVSSGLLLLKEGNRCRLDTKALVNSDDEVTVSIVSDGLKTRFEGAGKSKEIPRKTRNRFYWNELLRPGMLGASMLRSHAKPDKIEDQIYLVSNFGDGDAEKGARTLTYDLRLAGNKGAGKVKLWYDPKGYKLLRRTLQFENGEDNVKVEISETYEEYALDIEIPDDRFSLTTEK